MRAFSKCLVLLVVATVTVSGDELLKSKSVVDVNTENLTPPEGRANNDDIALPAKGLLTLGLLGTSMALLKHGLAPAEQVNEDQLFQRRDGGAHPHHPHPHHHSHPNEYNFYDNYARNVKAFEDKWFRGTARAALRLGTNLRRNIKATSNRLSRNFQQGLSNTKRALSVRSQILGRNTAHAARSVARATQHSLDKVRYATKSGLRRIGHNIRRAGEKVNRRTSVLAHNFKRAGKAAAHATARGIKTAAREAKSSARAATQTLGHSIQKVNARVGHIARSGLYQLANSYKRRLGRPNNYYRSVYNTVSRRMGPSSTTS